MVETRDSETGEIVKQLVDKVRRHKITRLKKTILAARKTKELVAKHKLPKVSTKDPTDSGFETVDSDEEEKKDDLSQFAEIGPSIFGNLSILEEEILNRLSKQSDSLAQVLPHLDSNTLRKGEVREYVDLAIDKNLDELTVNLLLKLKELYFKRKLKVPKGRKQMRPAKKRYIVGLNEVLKHLQAGNLTCVIIATNLEKVEIEKGIDDLIS